MSSKFVVTIRIAREVVEKTGPRSAKEESSAETVSSEASVREWPGQKWRVPVVKRGSAEAGEVEFDQDGVAFGRGDLDGRGVGFEGAGGEFKLEGGTAEDAAAVAVAGVSRIS